MNILDRMTVGQIGETARPLVVTIDITKERDAWMRKEVDLSSEDDIERALDDGYTIPEIARWLVAAREMGLVGPSAVKFLRDNKVLLFAGAAADTQSWVSRQKRIERLYIGGHEKVVRVRKRVGQVQERPEAVEGVTFESAGADGDSDEDDTPTREALPLINTERNGALAAENAKRYLENILLGHIRNQLVLIARAQLDVRAAAETLKAGIDGIVNDLVG